MYQKIAQNVQYSFDKLRNMTLTYGQNITLQPLHASTLKAIQNEGIQIKLHLFLWNHMQPNMTNVRNY